MDGMEEEEEIPVKYRLRGETDWQFKKEAVMKIGRTEWAIRLKMCKQGDEHQYYSLHVALLTPGRTSRIVIKCTREGETKTDWEQEYTFGGQQTVVINPCLMKIVEKGEKVTFVVEIRQLTEEDQPILNLPNEIAFPNGDFALKVGEQTLMLDSAYLKRRAPLLGYLFEDEENKQYAVDNVNFEDLVDAFGVFHHRWELSADRLLHLIPIARKLGFDIWGKSLDREFSQLLYRTEQLKLVPKTGDEPVQFEFNSSLKWVVEDLESIGLSSLPDNQNVMVAWEGDTRSCIIYAYAQEFFGVKYLSLGFQMSRQSTSIEPLEEEVNVIDDDSVSGSEYSDDSQPKYFDIDIHIVDDSGKRLISDKIRRVRDDGYTVVGSPVFARFEDAIKLSTEGNLQLEINWIENHDVDFEAGDVEDSLDYYTENENSVPETPKIRMPGVVNGEIRCEETVFQINKEYLSHNCGYFQGMFSKQFKEGREECVLLPKEKLSTLKLALDLIYNRRIILNDDEMAVVLDFADRTCSKTLTDGLQNQLWSNKEINIEDKQWFAEEFMLTDLKIKCAMEQNEELLKVARESRKRTRPDDFQDDPIEAPPAPNPERVLQEILDIPAADHEAFSS